MDDPVDSSLHLSITEPTKESDQDKIVSKELTEIKNNALPKVHHTTSFGSWLLQPLYYLFGGTSTSQVKVVNKEEPKSWVSFNDKVDHKVASFVERFGKDAGKTMSDQLREPLDRLAKSPVLQTGEILVVHTFDIKSIKFKSFLYYLGIFIFFLQFSKYALQRMFVRRRTKLLPKK